MDPAQAAPPPARRLINTAAILAALRGPSRVESLEVEAAPPPARRLNSAAVLAARRRLARVNSLPVEAAPPPAGRLTRPLILQELQGNPNIEIRRVMFRGEEYWTWRLLGPGDNGMSYTGSSRGHPHLDIRGILPANDGEGEGPPCKRARIGASREAIFALPETKAADAREMECAVCLQDFEADDILRMMPCSHSFHQHCILKWLLVSCVCPLCRHALPKQQHPDFDPKTVELVMVPRASDDPQLVS